MKLPDHVRERFKKGLVRGANHDCSQVVDEALTGSAPFTEIYQQLFRDGLYEVGEGWAQGRVSVAEEHRATAIVEGLMVDLFSQAVVTPPNGRHAVSACVGSEMHQVGARMVADVLESEGWQCAFVVGGLESGAVLHAVETEHATLVALSVTMSDSLPALEAQVKALRARFPELTIIAGGLALRGRGAEVCEALERVTWVEDLDGLVTFTRALASRG